MGQKNVAYVTSCEIKTYLLREREKNKTTKR